MQVLNGREEEIVNMLKDFGLCEYEAKMYFTLLAIGEAKVMEITRKASVPQSKAYNVLESLRAKGYVELSRIERPKKYRARVLKEVTDITIREKRRRIRELEESRRKLFEILQAIVPIHRMYNGLRLFSPSYKRR